MLKHTETGPDLDTKRELFEKPDPEMKHSTASFIILYGIRQKLEDIPGLLVTLYHPNVRLAEEDLMYQGPIHLEIMYFAKVEVFVDYGHCGGHSKKKMERYHTTQYFNII
jgi:hypothetical protein